MSQAVPKLRQSHFLAGALVKPGLLSSAALTETEAWAQETWQKARSSPVSRPEATSVELNYRNAERVCLLRWDQRSVEAGQHRGGSDQLEASQQPGLGPEVYTGAGSGKKNTHVLGWKPVLLSLDDGVLHECLWVCVRAVSWAGDLCVLAGLALALCCQVPAAGGFPGQPATWDVSVSRASGNAVCWGTQMRDCS